jgi:hypothetical protein
MALTSDEIRYCVDAITNKFLSSVLRKRMGAMWLEYGAGVVESASEDPDRRTSVDDSLDAMVLGESSSGGSM